MSVLFKIDHQSKKDLVYQTLKDAVIDLRWRPGEKKSFNEISGLLKVSRTPVAEACKLLEKEGWVIIRPQVGVEVAQLSAEEIEENFKIRGVLEGLAGLKALQHLTEADFLTLEHLCSEMEEASQKNNDLPTFIEKNHSFHKLICEASKMTELLKVLQHFWDNGKRYRVFYKHLPNVLKDSNQNHMEILSALKGKDVLSVRSKLEKDSWEFGEKLTQYLAKEKALHLGQAPFP
jgi:DNA-binding GntR family transcriptional regulator